MKIDSALIGSKFSESVHWNAISYALYKICTLSFTLVLYKVLSAQDFSSWATGQSIVFLLLLWLDGGLRKSIPRYAPDFAHSIDQHKKFMKNLLIYQMGIVLIGSAILWYALPWCVPVARSLGNVRLLILLIFVSEGLVGILRLIYHAYFLQKRFNLMYLFFVFLETIASFYILISNRYTTYLIVKWLFIIK